MKDADFNRNPKGNNQWVLRADDTIQKIINKYPTWTKKDFTGEGELNPDKKNALLTKTECEREKLVFGHVGKRRKPLKEIYKLSTKENISRFENKEIDEDTFRKNALSKSYRDKMSQSVKKKINKQKKRWANMSEVQKEIKRKGDRIFQKRKSEMKRKERLKNEKKDR